jgi:preprotein translocase subunit SecE
VFGTYYQWLIHDVRGQAVQFLRDVRSELRKVTFPSRKETLASTVVVLVVVFIIAVYLGIVDFGLSLILSSILK